MADPSNDDSRSETETPADDQPTDPTASSSEADRSETSTDQVARASNSDRSASEPPEPPEDVINEVTRLTRFVRRAVDDAEIEAYRDRRSDLLEEYGFTARVREDDTGDVLVCHPREWIDEEGTVRTDRIDDVDRAVERPLSGAGDPDDWESVADHNRSVARAVREEHGPVHGDNAEAFATYMSNHCAKRIESATPEDVSRFREDYFVRNAWPSDAQRSAIDESIEKTFEVAGVPDPRSPP